MCSLRASAATFIAAGLLLAACATDDGMVRVKPRTTVQYDEYAGAPIDKFITFGLQGWEYVGRDQLVVWNGVNEAYLLKVGGLCPDLPWVQRIAVTSTARSVSRFETVKVGRQSCPIDEIRPLDIKRLKANRSSSSSKTGPKS